MPRMATNSAMMASSSIDSQALTCTAPESKCSARSTRYSTLRTDKPAARMSSTFNRRTLAGVMRRGSLTNRSQTVWAALTEICWPTMLRASVTNASPRDSRHASPNCGMSRFMTRSFLARWRQASPQYAGVAIGNTEGSTSTGLRARITRSPPRWCPAQNP
jgi:hypothetical protein